MCRVRLGKYFILYLDVLIPGESRLELHISSAFKIFSLSVCFTSHSFMLVYFICFIILFYLLLFSCVSADDDYRALVSSLLFSCASADDDCRRFMESRDMVQTFYGKQRYGADVLWKAEVWCRRFMESRGMVQTFYGKQRCFVIAVRYSSDSQFVIAVMPNLNAHSPRGG